VEYKGFKFKFNLKGDICRGLLIRTVYQSVVADGTVKKFKYNNIVLIKKKQQFKSKYLYGPVPLEIKRKKILSLFPLVI
jgi:ribosomal protein L14